MHTVSTDFNLDKLLSMFVLAVFPLFQNSFHAWFRFLFPLFRPPRYPYSCPSIERNSAGIIPVSYNGFKHNLTAARLPHPD
jgi:hypothetical protein